MGDASVIAKQKREARHVAYDAQLFALRVAFRNSIWEIAGDNVFIKCNLDDNFHVRVDGELLASDYAWTATLVPRRPMPFPIKSDLSTGAFAAVQDLMDVWDLFTTMMSPALVKRHRFQLKPWSPEKQILPDTEPVCSYRGALAECHGLDCPVHGDDLPTCLGEDEVPPCDCGTWSCHECRDKALDEACGDIFASGEPGDELYAGGVVNEPAQGVDLEGSASTGCGGCTGCDYRRCRDLKCDGCEDRGECDTPEAMHARCEGCEDRDEGKAGYIHCACRDCMDVTIGLPGEFCSDCVDAGCEPNEKCSQEA